MPKKSEDTTRVLFGSTHYEWPYYLSIKQIEKVKRLYVKYQERAHEYGRKHRLFSGLTCYKRLNFSNVSIVVCYLVCEPTKGGCIDFLNGYHFCNTLKCPHIKDCFTRGENFRKKKCKKMNLAEERRLVKRKYDHFILLHKMARGFKLDPLKTIKFLKTQKKKKEENGKIQAKSGKKKTPKGQKETKKRHKKNP